MMPNPHCENGSQVIIYTYRVRTFHLERSGDFL